MGLKSEALIGRDDTLNLRDRQRHLVGSSLKTYLGKMQNPIRSSGKVVIL